MLAAAIDGTNSRPQTKHAGRHWRAAAAFAEIRVLGNWLPPDPGQLHVAEIYKRYEFEIVPIGRVSV